MKKRHNWTVMDHRAFGSVTICKNCGRSKHNKSTLPYCEPVPWPVIRLNCIRELGYALVYIEYLHADMKFKKQLGAVKKLCKELAKNQSKDDLQYWVMFQYRIGEETENLC
jgi:hypothetical protein